MKFAKRVFLVAGIYGLVALLPQYFLEQKIGRDFPPAITHPEHFYGFIGIAIAWQLAFLVIARDPARYRLVMLPGIIEKTSFGIAVIALYLQHRVAGSIVFPALLDLVLGGLFVVAYWRTRPQNLAPPKT